MSPERRKDRNHFAEVTQRAKETVMRDGGHVPLLIVEGSRASLVTQLPDVPNTHSERVELMRFLDRMTARSGRVGALQQVFFISEGWMSMANEGQPPQNPPSQDPARKEVLVISGLEVQGMKRKLKIFEMIRGKEQRVIDLTEVLAPEGKEREVEIPLLDAFARGFRLAFQTRVN